MGNKLRDEDLNLNIIVNGDKGKKELGDLEKSTRELTNRNKELRAEKERLIRAGKQESAEYKAVTKEITENNRAIKANEARMTELRKEIGLTGLTMKQLRSEQTRLKRLMDSATPGTPQWKMYRAELDKVEAQMAKVRAGSQRMRLSIGSVADGFNRFAAMGATAIATLTGIVFSIKSFVQGMVGLDDQLADVMKTTGMTRDQVRLLYQDFKTLNTRTPRKELLLLAEEAGRLGKKSRQDVLDFVEVANQIKVALGDDLGGESEVAIREVGKLTDIYKIGEKYGTEFKESMLKVGSAINEVSANSNAQAPFLIDYLKRMGGVAVQSKINAAEIIGYASALDQLGQTQEMSATAHGKVMVDMFKDSAKYANIAKMSAGDFANLLNTDANEAFLKVLEGLNGSNDGMAVMAQRLDELGVDGARAVQVLAALAANTDKVRKEQALANKAMDEGISLTNEYNVKNNNLAASVSKVSQYIHAKLINSTFLGWLEKVVGKMADWVELPLSKTLQNEQRELNLLISAVTNANNTQETRNSLIAELQEAYPDFLKNLDAEKVTNEELRDRLTEVNKQYENKILLAIREEALQDNYKNRVDLKIKELDLIKDIASNETKLAELKTQQSNTAPLSAEYNELAKQIAIVEGNINGYTNSLERNRNKVADLVTEETELNAAVEELRKSLADPGAVNPGPGAGVSGGGSVTVLPELSDKEIKKRIEKLEASYNQELALIRKKHLEGKSTEDQYNADLLQAELTFLADKLKIYNKGSKEYEQAIAQSLEKQVQVDKTIKDLLLAAEKELASAKIENIDDALQKAEEAEAQRWVTEEAALKKRLIDKQNLSVEEIAINDTINQIIEQKELEHQNRLRAIRSGGNVSDLQNLLTAATPVDPNFATLEQQQAFFDARMALIEAQYAREKELAGTNQSALLAADAKYKQQSYQVKSDQIDAEYALNEKRIGTAQNYVSMLASVVDQESALGKALFLFNQALAIGDVWMNIAKANAKAIAASPLTLGQPWVGINTTQGAIQTGVILAQSIAKFTKGKKDGGYTGQAASDDQVMGVYHANEWFANAKAVRNPEVKQFLDVFDYYQRTGQIANLNTKTILASIPAGGQMASGGYASQSKTPAPASNPPQPYTSSISPDSIDRFDRAIERLEKMELVLSVKDVADKLAKRELRDRQSKL